MITALETHYYSKMRISDILLAWWTDTSDETLELDKLGLVDHEIILNSRMRVTHMLK